MESIEKLAPGVSQTKTALFRQRGYLVKPGASDVLIVYGNEDAPAGVGPLLWDNDVVSTTVTTGHVEAPASGVV